MPSVSPTMELVQEDGKYLARIDFIGLQRRLKMSHDEVQGFAVASIQRRLGISEEEATQIVLDGIERFSPPAAAPLAAAQPPGEFNAKEAVRAAMERRKERVAESQSTQEN